MPRARIVTRFPQSVASLAEYLEQCGYVVDIGAPEQAGASPADVEINIETCTPEQAFHRAAELSSLLDADVVVAPGVAPTRTVNVDQPVPANERTEEIAPELVKHSQNEGPSRLAVTLQTARDAMAEWRVRGRQNAKNAKERLLAFGSVVWINSQKVADQLRARGAEWVQRWHASRQLARERAAEAAAAREAKLQQARLLAQEQARILAQAESLRQELERERLLAEQQQRERQAQEAAARAALLREQREREAALHEQEIREQRAREASAREAHFTQQQEQREAQQNELPQPETEQEKLWVPAAHDAAPSLPPRSVRYAPQPRTSLLAYTRNRSRDLKMAFLGAAAASALILFASFGFMHRTPPGRDMQQKLPFGAATVGPTTPSLILPTAKPAPAPAQVRVVAKQKKQPAPISRRPAKYQPARTQQEALEDEVVVRHFPTAGHAAKARPDNDGVRRISDLQ